MVEQLKQAGMTRSELVWLNGSAVRMGSARAEWLWQWTVMLQDWLAGATEELAVLLNEADVSDQSKCVG